MKGHFLPHSIESRMKMSVSRKRYLSSGGKIWNTGKNSITPELREKLNLGKIGKPSGMLGKKHTEEWKKQHSLFMKRQSPEYFKKCLSRRGMSSLETRVNTLVKDHNLPYRFVGDGKFTIENKCPDFINTNGKKIAVEVFYKRHKEQLRNMSFEDWKSNRNKIFAKYGWKVIYIDGTRIANNTIVDVLKGGD